MTYRMSPFLLVAASLSLLAYSGPAWADCPSPPPLIWSYPADGATEIPTDAVLIVAGSPAAVTLDGVALEPLGAGFSYDLGELTAGTTYTVTLEASEGSAAVDATVTFVTGSGPAPDATSQDVPEVSPDICSEVQSWQGCFDTGSPDRFELLPESDAQPIAWGILDVAGSDTPIGVWPAGCGAIQVSASARSLYYAEEIFVNGPGEEVPASAVGEEAHEKSGCSFAEPSRGGALFAWLTWCGLALLLVARRFLGRA